MSDNDQAATEATASKNKPASSQILVKELP